MGRDKMKNWPKKMVKKKWKGIRHLRKGEERRKMKKVEKMVYIYHESRTKNAEVKFKFYEQKEL